MLAHVTEPGPLIDCAAIVVGHDEHHCTALLSLGHRVGFGSVTAYSQSAEAERLAHRLPFFLVHYGIGVSAKKQLLAELRGTASDNIRFAPVVLFVPDGPSEEILFYIEMGFDDVICLPENSHVLSGRLAAQIGQEHLYIETRTYLGPDRRRMELPGHSHPDRTGGYEYSRLTIFRSADLGVQILRRQLFFKGRAI